MLRTCLVTGLILLAVVGSTFARPVSHYSMGPVRHYAPAADDEATMVSFANGISLDTRSGEPNLPAQLKLDEASAEAQYYIIQFTGPILGDWSSALERLGVKSFGYLPRYAVLAKMNPGQREQVAALPMVRWTGLYQPAYRLQAELLETTGPKDVVVMALPGEDPAPITSAIEASGGTVREVMTTSFAITITASLDGADIPAIARLPQTFWIQEWTEGSFCNNNCQWVMQSGYLAGAPPDTSSAARPVWRHGVRGQGVILSTTDTGLNIGHNMFRDPAQSVTPPGIWPGHRKVVAYKKFGTADASEGQYHGSHVNGTVAGNDSITGGTSYYDGMAKDARLYFVDITNGTSFLVPNDHTPMWDTAYAGRGLPDSVRPIKQHSGSWGWSSSSGTYLIQDASTDNFCWTHKDFFCLMAAGNESSTRRLRNPGIAKDVLTIGALNNGTGSNSIASFSSRGPTQDNRIKPNVMAPGVDLWSAQSSGQSGYSQMSGTSMATPAANGTVGLMRCYLQEGYYPTGAPVPGNRISYVTAALMRSMAMASADPNIGSYTIPDFNIGWGRLDADSVLYFTGDTRKLLIVDDTTGVATGEYKETRFRVNSAIPLRVCLAWTDTAAAPSANPTLVNDLNLELTAPGGTQYRGNKYSSGQSQPNPSSWDNVNVEECARVNAPDTGLWTLRVYGQNVATHVRQWFAWTMTGDVALPAATHDVGATAIVAPADTVDSGVVVTPEAAVQNFGTAQETFVARFTIADGYEDTVHVTLPAGGSQNVQFADWTPQSTGVFAVRCTTELPGDVDPANDAAHGSVVVVPPTGIAEQPGLPKVFSLDRVTPNPFTGATAIRFGIPRSTHVGLSIHSAAGTQVRTICNSTLPPAHYSLTWNGRDEQGLMLPAGIYFCRLTAGDYRATRKVVLQR